MSDKWEMLHREQMELISKKEALEKRIKDIKAIQEEEAYRASKTSFLLEELANHYAGYNHGYKFRDNYQNYVEKSQQVKRQLEVNHKELQDRHCQLDKKIEDLFRKKRDALGK